MKITFVTASLGSGGSERVVSLLSNCLSERGYDIEIICLKYNEVYYSLNEKVHVTLANKEMTSHGLLTEIFWFRKHIKCTRPDVVIAFTEGVYCFVICALLYSGIPVISSERNDPSTMSIIRKVLRKVFLPYTSGLVVQTLKIKKYFPGKIQRKTSVIFNPVDGHVFNNKPTAIKQQIINVARLYPQKNHLMLIDAFSKISSTFPNCKLMIYGEGPMRCKLEKYIRSINLQNKIFLPGRSKNVIEEMRHSQIFCLSSDYEGMSNSMIEAVCVGLPIVSTRVSGTEELVKDGKNGYLVDCGDTDSLAESLSKLLRNPGQCKSFAEYSKSMCEMFNLDKIADEWLVVIEKVIKEHRVNK